MGKFTDNSGIKVASVEVTKYPTDGYPRVLIEYDRRTGPEPKDWATGIIRSDAPDYNDSLKDIGENSTINRILTWAQSYICGPRIDKVSYRNFSGEAIITSTSVQYVSDDPDIAAMKWQAHHIAEINDPEGAVHKAITQAEHGKGYIKLTGIDYRGKPAFENVQSMLIQERTITVTLHPTSDDYRLNQTYIFDLSDNHHVNFMMAVKQDTVDQFAKLVLACSVISQEDGYPQGTSNIKDRVLADILNTTGSNIYSEIKRSEALYQSCQRQIGQGIE